MVRCTGAQAYWLPVSLLHLDSPNTTSAITYKLQWATESSGGSASVYYLNRKGASANDGAISSITVMEVAV